MQPEVGPHLHLPCASVAEHEPPAMEVVKPHLHSEPERCEGSDDALQAAEHSGPVVRTFSWTLELRAHRGAGNADGPHSVEAARQVFALEGIPKVGLPDLNAGGACRPGPQQPPVVPPPLILTDVDAVDRGLLVVAPLSSVSSSSWIRS